ncbi:sialate O-acetylesterase [Lelliottia sp. WAP21]|uniref:sialate O-acetylesterase n=1 Tax=Lelliottia sp. WAP21 TaxID=2877426 RepID=UPI001E36445A|nr:sialate O-acetylesterase [Lelliottia sp. WAP21]
MTTTPTNRPVPSESPIDLKFNAGKIDEFVTSFAEWYIDRFGNKHYTIEGLKNLVLEQIYALGWNPVGTFQGGAIVNNPGDIVQDTTSGAWYRWDDLSTLPKTVPSGSTPGSSGGTGEGKWQLVDVSDVLRKQLADVNSTVNIAGVPASQVAQNVKGTKYLEAPDVYDIIVTYGQSNSAGEAILSGDTSGFPSPLPKSLMYDFTDGTIKPIIQAIVSSSGVASSGHAWGEFTNEWYRLSGRGAVVVHCGRGATSLAQLSKGASSGASDYYGFLVAGVNNAISRMVTQGLTLGKVYVLFHQGETDQQIETSFDAYRGLFVTLIDNLAADIPLARFANCTVGSPKNRPEYTWQTIQNAQRYVVNGRDIAVTAFDGCPSFLNRDGNVGTEGVHYTQKGYNTMGAGAARGLWAVEKGGAKTKTPEDLLQYTANNVAPWLRAKHCAAATRYASSSSSWQILNFNNDTGVMRPSNISKVAPAADGNSLLFTISDNASCWFDFNAYMNRTELTSGLYAIADRANVGTDYNLRVTIYANLDIIVNVNTAEIRVGRPAATPPAWIASLVSAAGSAGLVTLTHGATTTLPSVSYYAGSTLVDTSATVGVNAPSATQTIVMAANVTSSPWVAVSLKNVLVKPAFIQALGTTIFVSGTYAPDF